MNKPCMIALEQLCANYEKDVRTKAYREGYLRAIQKLRDWCNSRYTMNNQEDGWAQDELEGVRTLMPMILKKLDNMEV